MLVLSRLEGEFILLDVPSCPNGCCPARRLAVGVSSIRGRKVRLALDAPRDVEIRRAELLPPHQQSGGRS